jgi:type IX secretion system PorP/SprF family membrane protein
MKILLLTGIALICTRLTQAQDHPAFQLGATNPFLYNPAAAGYAQRPALTVSRRQQWVGFPGAPVTNFLQFHTPVRKSVLLGTTLVNDSRSALTGTSVQLTGGYRVKFGPQHYISFALSGGAGFHRLDPDVAADLEGNDPVLAYAFDQTAQALGNAGIRYDNQGFSLGFALPQLFRNKLEAGPFPDFSSFSPLDRFMVQAGWRIPLSENLELEPQVFYHHETWRTPGFEVAATAYMYKKLWLGGAYRTDLGGAAFLGMKIYDHLQFTYAYGVAPGTIGAEGFFQYSTHELQLSLLFGSEPREVLPVKKVKKTYSRTNIPAPVKQTAPSAAPKTAPPPAVQPASAQNPAPHNPAMTGRTVASDSSSTATTAPPYPAAGNSAPKPKTFTVIEGRRKPRLDYRREMETRIPAQNTESRPATGPQQQPAAAVPEQEHPIDTLVQHARFSQDGKYEGPSQLQRGNHMLELDEGHYVVIGVFGTFAQAEEYSDKMFGEGHYTKYGYATETKMYFVYIYHSRDFNQSRNESERLRRLGLKFRENMVLTIK